MRLSLNPPPNLFLRCNEVPMQLSLPPLITATRSPKMSASSMECVVRITAHDLRSVAMLEITRHMKRRATGSLEGGGWGAVVGGRVGAG